MSITLEDLQTHHGSRRAIVDGHLSQMVVETWLHCMAMEDDNAFAVLKAFHAQLVLARHRGLTQ